MTAPALLVAIPLLLGVVVGSSLGAPPGTSAALGILWTACGILIFAPVPLPLRARGGAVAVLAIAGCLAAGIRLGAAAQRAAAQPSLLAWWQTHGEERAVRLTGVLRDDAASTGNAVGFTLEATDAEGRRVDGGVRVSVAGRMAGETAREWRAGRTVTLDTQLREPLDYRDPGVPGDRERLARQGIVLLGSVKSAELVTVRAHGP